MKNKETLTHVISAAFGRECPDIIFTNCGIVNVFTNEIEKKDLAVCDGYIAGIGDYSREYQEDKGEDGPVVTDLGGAIICPGLIDGHIHIESSMLTPKEFAKSVIPHGTTAVITDPHEIANVAGINGIEYMLENSEGLPMDVFFALPSCVPATPLDEAGACLTAEELSGLLSNDRVVGLAEMMNAFGTVRNDEEIIKKIMLAKEGGKVVDGHAPGLTGKELNAYAAAGVQSDHECAEAAEAIEKLRLGQWIMIREGTAAQNLEKLLVLFDEKYYGRCLLVTDDKHPGDLIKYGHIDYIVRKAVRLGADPVRAVKMASFNAASYFGIKDKGAIAPGYRADFIVVDSLIEFNIKQVYYLGKKVAENGHLTDSEQINTSIMARYLKVYNSFSLDALKPSDFEVEIKGENRRVIGLVPGQILTTEYIATSDTSQDTENDIVKVALIERHNNTGHIGCGYLKGYGLKKGAIASSIGHDSHNLIVAGVSDGDMALAANAVRENKGGLSVVCDGRVLGTLALPVAGIMCEMTAEETEIKLDELKKYARSIGVAEGIDPFMTLSFASLPVIPALRITTKGLCNAATQSIVPVTF